MAMEYTVAASCRTFSHGCEAMERFLLSPPNHERTKQSLSVPYESTGRNMGPEASAGFSISGSNEPQAFEEDDWTAAGRSISRTLYWKSARKHCHGKSEYCHRKCNPRATVCKIKTVVVETLCLHGRLISQGAVLVSSSYSPRSRM